MEVKASGPRYFSVILQSPPTVPRELITLQRSVGISMRGERKGGSEEKGQKVGTERGGRGAATGQEPIGTHVGNDGKDKVG